jgi:hypothetical protein
MTEQGEVHNLIVRHRAETDRAMVENKAAGPARAGGAAAGASSCGRQFVGRREGGLLRATYGFGASAPPT